MYLYIYASDTSLVHVTGLYICIYMKREREREREFFTRIGSNMIHLMTMISRPP